MLKLFAFLNPYKLWIYGGLIVAVIGYVSYLNIRINWLKSDNAKLEAKNVLWEATVQTLSESVEKQNKAVQDVLDLSNEAKAASAKRLKELEARKAIRQQKITAATARIVIEHPSECANAIDEAIGELQP